MAKYIWIIGLMISILLVSGISGCVQKEAQSDSSLNIEEIQETHNICLDVLTINLYGYTFYDKDANQILIAVDRSIIESVLVGIKINITGDNFALIKNLENGKSYSDIKEFGQDYNQAISLPGLSETRTYIFDVAGMTGTPEMIHLTPIIEINGKKYSCPISVSHLF